MRDLRYSLVADSSHTQWIRYRPWLETLEPRLQAGDTLLSLLASWALIDPLPTVMDPAPVARRHQNTEVAAEGGSEPLVAPRDQRGSYSGFKESGQATHQIRSNNLLDIPAPISHGAPPVGQRDAGFRFAVIGDYGLAGIPEMDVADLVDTWTPDFVVTVGDNNYEFGEASTIVQNIGQYYCDYIHNPDAPAGQICAGPAQNQFFPAPGNHDWNNTIGAPLSPYLDYFTLPAGQGNERYYDFVRGPIHFFALDSDIREPDGTSSTSTQAQWLQGALASAAEPWKVVYFHHAPYSSGNVHGGEVYMQWPFQQWGASVVLAGHDHIYERILHNGLTYFVNGLGGKSIHQFGPIIPGSQVQYNADYGAMLVQGDESAMTFQFISRRRRDRHPHSDQAGDADRHRGIDVEVPGRWLESGYRLAPTALQRRRLGVRPRPTGLRRRRRSHRGQLRGGLQQQAHHDVFPPHLHRA